MENVVPQSSMVKPTCECPLPYRYIEPERHHESCPVVRWMFEPINIVEDQFIGQEDLKC
jgi:hypothetical protein